MCCQEIMASVKSASLVATATDHSLYLKFIKVTTCTLLVPTLVPIVDVSTFSGFYSPNQRLYPNG